MIILIKLNMKFKIIIFLRLSTEFKPTLKLVVGEIRRGIIAFINIIYMP